jgi:endonuclease III
MKISSEYVKGFHSLQNKLRKDFPKPKDRDFETLPENATEMLILGILSTNETFYHAKQAMKVIQEKMVDLNELRVTPAAELALVIEEYLDEPQKASTEIVKTLNIVFTRFDTLNLSELKEKNKTDLIKLFEEIPGCPDHARCAMLLFSFEIPNMPMDDRMLEYLIGAKAVPAQIDLPTARAFIERQLKAAQLGEFYWQLRKASEADDKKRKPKKT